MRVLGSCAVIIYVLEGYYTYKYTPTRTWALCSSIVSGTSFFHQNALEYNTLIHIFVFDPTVHRILVVKFVRGDFSLTKCNW